MAGGRRVAVIGTGRMGSGIASRLASAGFSVVVWNRSIEKARRLEEEGITVAPTLHLALGHAEAAILSLPDDDAVLSVIGSMGRNDGLVIIDTSTITPDTALKASRIASEQGACYVASPVIGGPGAAASGNLVVLASGPRRCIASVRDVLDSISRRVFILSEDPGVSAAVKLAYNSILFSFIASLSEARLLSESYGVSRDVILEILSETVFAEPGKRYLEKMEKSDPEDATFPIMMALKDLDYAVIAGSRKGVPMNMARLAGGLYAGASRHGCGNYDYAGLYKWMKDGRC